MAIVQCIFNEHLKQKLRQYLNVSIISATGPILSVRIISVLFLVFSLNFVPVPSGYSSAYTLCTLL